MGTSKDRTAGSGGDWTPLKTATTSWLRGLRDERPSDVVDERARRVLSRHVAVLGGAGAAASTATAGTVGLQRLAGLLTGVAGPGLAATLRQLGLASLVGRDRFDVLDELATLIAGDGDDLDSTAARFAVCDVLDEMFDDAESWVDLEGVDLNAEQVRALLDEFLSRFIHNRMPVIAERLARISDPAQAQEANDQMLQVIRASVSHVLGDLDVFTVDWSGAEGRRLAERMMATAYETLEDVWGEE